MSARVGERCFRANDTNEASRNPLGRDSLCLVDLVFFPSRGYIFSRYTCSLHDVYNIYASVCVFLLFLFSFFGFPMKM